MPIKYTERELELKIAEILAAAEEGQVQSAVKRPQHMSRPVRIDTGYQGQSEITELSAPELTPRQGRAALNLDVHSRRSLGDPRIVYGGFSVSPYEGMVNSGSTTAPRGLVIQPDEEYYQTDLTKLDDTL